jgi:hypothetical protein
MKKKVEPDSSLCFDGFNKTKRQEKDHNITECKER